MDLNTFVSQLIETTLKAKVIINKLKINTELKAEINVAIKPTTNGIEVINPTDVRNVTEEGELRGLSRYKLSLKI